jgi:hypothetical protein
MAAEHNLTFDWDGYQREMHEHGISSGGGQKTELFRYLKSVLSETTTTMFGEFSSFGGDEAAKTLNTLTLRGNELIDSFGTWDAALRQLAIEFPYDLKADTGATPILANPYGPPLAPSQLRVMPPASPTQSSAAPTQSPPSAAPAGYVEVEVDGQKFMANPETGDVKPVNAPTPPGPGDWPAPPAVQEPDAYGEPMGASDPQAVEPGVQTEAFGDGETTLGPDPTAAEAADPVEGALRRIASKDYSLLQESTARKVAERNRRSHEYVMGKMARMPRTNARGGM